MNPAWRWSATAASTMPIFTLRLGREGSFVLYAITADSQLTYAKAVERLAWRDRVRRDTFVHKYEGITLFDDNRIYLFDWQPQLTNIFSMTVLYPSLRSRVTLLSGIVTSVTGGVSRRPYASKIVFERLAECLNFRQALEPCGVCRKDLGRDRSRY